MSSVAVLSLSSPCLDILIPQPMSSVAVLSLSSPCLDILIPQPMSSVAVLSLPSPCLSQIEGATRGFYYGPVTL